MSHFNSSFSALNVGAPMIAPKDLMNQVIDSCSSTNDLAKKLGEDGCPHGTWVSTRTQTSGRGRLGRTWLSSPGNLLFSIVARLDFQTSGLSLLSWIPLTVAVAITKTLRNEYDPLDVKVKWPNDIWLNDAKLGGVLCETSGQTSPLGMCVIIGVGLNFGSVPSGLPQRATSLSSVLGEKYQSDVDRMRNVVIQAILDEIENLQRYGSEPIRDHYVNWAQFPSGTKVKWGVSEMKTGIILENSELGPSGELLIREQSTGRVRGLFSEDVVLFCE